MRVSRDEMLMAVAEAVARRGTCSRKQVGVVAARDGRVLVTGYNGSPAGMAHCEHETLAGYELVERGIGVDDDPQASPMWVPQKTYYLTDVGGTITVSTTEACTVSVHAEANLIAFAARHGIRLEGSQIYTTCSPCVPCAKLIINAGVSCVVSKEHYRDPHGANLLTQVGIEVRVHP